MAAVAMLLALSGPAPTAAAITPPVVDPGALPPNDPPHPLTKMRPFKSCIPLGMVEGVDVSTPSPSQAFMNLPMLWQVAGSKGAGQAVAMIDTGVTPSPRFTHLRGGGDYVADSDGLTDCDGHGSAVASIISAAPSDTDPLVGVAPDADVVSIRQSSLAFTPEGGGNDEEVRAGDVNSLAYAVRHAADIPGIRVMNISVVSCISVIKPVDQTTLGAALRYAAVEKNIVIVAAAGNSTNAGCGQTNPDVDATRGADFRNWGSVVTVSTPAWFSDYVLSVGFTDAAGAPAKESLPGPWVGVGAPGVSAFGLNGDQLYTGRMGNNGKLEPLNGTSFAAPYVAGLALLVRAKFPDLTAAQVIWRIEQTAHSPAQLIDNRIGYGVIDPVAALTWDVQQKGPATPVEHLSRPVVAPPPPPGPDRRGRNWALAGFAALALTVVSAGAVGLVRAGGRKELGQ